MAAGAQLPIRDVVDYELLFDCVHCGLCLEACPTYVLTRAEMDSPRGRIYLMKALAERHLELDSDVTRHLDFCLGCRACETACPSGVRYGRLIERARSYVERNYRRRLSDRFKRWAIGALFPFPWRLRLALAPLRLIERAQLRSLVERIAPTALRDWIELLPSVTPAAQERSEVISASHSGPRVAAHRGCVVQVLADSANLNSERLLAAAGYSVTPIARSVCCGALDLHSGNRKRALRFARANVRALAASGAEAIVSAASGCSAAMAEYGHLLEDDVQLADAAREVSARVKDLSGLLLKGAWTGGKLHCTVTYHDACHLAHAMGVRDAPRQLLRSIAGLKLVEMADSDMCCGSAGSYNLTEPEAARALAARKVDSIIATGADYVVMANAGCQFQIAAELRRRGAKTRAIHIADFAARAAEGRTTRSGGPADDARTRC